MKSKPHPTGGGRKKKFKGETKLVAFRIPADFEEQIKVKVYRLLEKYR